MKRIYYLLGLVLFCLISCTPKVVLKNEFGRVTPNTTLNITTTGEVKIQALTTLALETIVEDADGTKISSYEFLNVSKENVVSKKKNLLLIVDIVNPDEQIYTVSLLCNNPKQTDVIGTSNLNYRQFIIHLPVLENGESQKCFVGVTSEKSDYPVVILGPFKYRSIYHGRSNQNRVVH